MRDPDEEAVNFTRRLRNATAAAQRLQPTAIDLGLRRGLVDSIDEVITQLAALRKVLDATGRE